MSPALLMEMVEKKKILQLLSHKGATVVDTEPELVLDSFKLVRDSIIFFL